MTIRLKIIFAYLILAILPQSVSALEVPLNLSDKNWQILEYSSIKPNTLTQLDDGIKISVKETNSPLIYVFDSPQVISKVKVTGVLGKLPVFPEGVEQGSKDMDDFVLRFGLVIPGKRRLNFAQKLIAAKWVKTLFELAPDKKGIDRVEFLDLANPEAISWQQRDIAGTQDLLKERIVQHVQANQPFVLDYTFDQPIDTLALWISSDGDESKSTFDLIINSVTVE